MRLLSCILIGALTFAMSACSMSSDAALAEKEVGRFHQALDAGQFDQLYGGGSDDLKKAANQQEFVALLDAVHRKLGNVSSSTETTWNVNYHTSGTFVRLVYDTTFLQGKGTEEFVYRVSGNEAHLAGYHINSSDLIIR